MSGRQLMAVLAVGMASGLAGAETYDASTGYVTLKASDAKVSGNQTYSLTPDYQYHRWSDGQPHPAIAAPIGLA